MRIDDEAIRQVQQSGAHSRPRSRFSRTPSNVEPLTLRDHIKHNIPLLRTLDVLRPLGDDAGGTTAPSALRAVNQHWER
jgi:hypothetical protein